MLFAPSVLGTVLMPMIASADKSDTSTRSALLLKPLFVAGALGTVLALACIGFADSILNCYGAGFQEAKPGNRMGRRRPEELH